jgi:nucleotide-binding universal stress UspA family protein
MYANILLSTDGSDVATKGVKHGMNLAKALNAKVTVINVTEPLLLVDYWSGVSQEEVDRFDAARKERAHKVLDEAELWRSRSGFRQNSCIFRMRTQPQRSSKQQGPEAAT